MDAKTNVDRLHDDFSELLAFLKNNEKISLHNIVEYNFRKLLLVSAASYFEKRLTDFVKSISNKKCLYSPFDRGTDVGRQYHKWFDWDCRNANKFFKIFGKDCEKCLKELLKEDCDIQGSIKAFMEIGRDRNRLVHGDFSAFSLEKTSQEIYQHYCEAKKFVDWIHNSIGRLAEKMDDYKPAFPT